MAQGLRARLASVSVLGSVAGPPARSLRRAARAVKHRSRSSRLPLGLVQVLRRTVAQKLASGEVAEAETVLERLEQEDPLGEETRAFRLELLSRTNRIAEALVLARQLVELFPASARIHYLAGRLAYGQRDYTAALRSFRESDRLAPHWRHRLAVGKTLTQK